MILTGLIVIALITSWVNFYRAEVWWTGKYETPTEQVAQKFVETLRGESANEMSVEAINQFVQF